MEQLENLRFRQRRLRNNKNLALIGGIFILYSTFSNAVGAPMYYLAIMIAMVVALFGISFYGHKQVKLLNVEIDALEEEERKLNLEKNEEALNVINSEEIEVIKDDTEV